MSIIKTVIELFNSLLSRKPESSERLTEAKETIREAKAEWREERQDVKTIRKDKKQLKLMRDFVKKAIGRNEYKKLSTDQIIETYYEIKSKLDGEIGT